MPGDLDVAPGLRFRGTNRLPADDRVLRRLLKGCARRSRSHAAGTDADSAVARSSAESPDTQDRA